MGSLARVVRDTLTVGDSRGSLAGWARNRRWAMLLRRFPGIAGMHVIDLGGTPQYWTAAPVRPAHVTVLNLTAVDGEVPRWVDAVVGDACNAVDAFGDREFDLAFSNSTIEHVGGHTQCLAFAYSVSQLAPHHWVQTPYRYFPIEPHWLFPGFQFLPVALRCRITKSWPLSYTRSRGDTIDDPASAVMSTVLLSKTELAHYFPESEILSEVVMGLTKSIIAVR